MYVADPAYWSDIQRQTLACYDEALLRQVAARLVKPRNQWPVEDLIERSAAATSNPVVIDRRLQDLTPPARRVLALIGHSRQPYWNLGSLVELTIALGHSDGLQPALELLEAGLLYPSLRCTAETPSTNGVAGKKIKSFEQWMGTPGPSGLLVFTPPQIAVRAIGEDLGLPDLSESERTAACGVAGNAKPQAAVQEADGLEWLLRLAVLWQQVSGAPLRRTQQGGFFKRDVERLQQDVLLNAAPADRLADVPDAAFLAIALAEQERMIEEVEGEWRAGPLPPVWDKGLTAALESLWMDLPRLSAWNPLDGWRGGEPQTGNPFPSAYLLAFLLLARLPEGASVRPETIEEWILTQHPYWTSESLRPSRQKPWLGTFLLGVAYQLRLVQAVRAPTAPTGETPVPPSTDRRDAGPTGWRVRLSPTGRWLLGLAEAPSLETVYTQTLLVQPNLQILAYRQGLSSSLIARLTQLAAWENLGAACTLQLQPETVYRALEAGQTFDSIRLTLEQHGTRSLPPAVLDSLRTWSNKRDRITLYPSATLLEFGSAEDLNEALARGLPAVRLSDRLAVVVSEEAIEFRHFRLTGTRDYALPPEKCVHVEADGVTLSVDLARSDLLLETEIPRFAELVGGSTADGRRQFRLTPASLSAGRSAGVTLTTLETWFHQRAGQQLPPAARLLMTAGLAEPPRLRRHLVLHVVDEDLADGLVQWPQTRELIEERLGPTALVVAEENVAALRERLSAAGITIATI
ncbi:MAG TPA: helicase-associated domain-containing protein [Gemmataceae bacterium]|nr:helicase-associated domain-containing protein [Gemmataceae bacterium]